MVLNVLYSTFTLHFIALPFMLRSIVHVQSIFVRAMRPAASTVSDVRSSRLHLLKRLPSPPERICSFVEDWLAGAAGILGSGPSTCVLSSPAPPRPGRPSSARVQPCVPSRLSEALLLTQHTHVATVNTTKQQAGTLNEIVFHL